jgi:hypothetical protein
MMFKPWWDVAMLVAEAQQVIGLRLLKLAAGGPPASAEARRMVSEKVAAATLAAAGIVTGDSSTKVVKRYRKKVRANRRRLSR